jgi:hypothetical protein
LYHGLLEPLEKPAIGKPWIGIQKVSGALGRSKIACARGVGFLRADGRHSAGAWLSFLTRDRVGAPNEVTEKHVPD